MKTIRKGVFETNSSSTHSICICTDEELKAWQDDEIRYDSWKEEFISTQEIINSVKEENPELTDSEIEEFMEDNISEFPKSYGNWGDEYEIDHNTYTTKSGDKINILCYYGYNY